MISINVLLYGDYTQLAKRCLDSIRPILIPKRISEVRIGLNGVSQESRSLVRDWLAELPVEIDWKVFDPGKNVWKYPLMRRMFHCEKLPMVMGAATAKPPLTMWFDDDSHLRCSSSVAEEFLNTLEYELSQPSVGMAGELWLKDLEDGQVDWVKNRPWYTGVQIPRRTKFLTGGWWTIRTEIIRKFDWPDVTIRHNGGDTALGQLLLQHHYLQWDIRPLKIVKINDAPRRGDSQRPAGSRYRPDDDVDISHHNFSCQVYSKGADQL